MRTASDRFTPPAPFEHDLVGERPPPSNHSFTNRAGEAYHGTSL
jgi:hypothetical protein